MPSTVAKYFATAHLPTQALAICKPFEQLAQLLETALPDGPEKSAGMRKLLEAKDCMFRAALDVPAQQLLANLPITDTDRIDVIVKYVCNFESEDQPLSDERLDAIMGNGDQPITRDKIIQVLDEVITHDRKPSINTEGPDEYDGDRP